VADYTARDASYPSVKKRMVGYREPDIRYAPEADTGEVTLEGVFARQNWRLLNVAVANCSFFWRFSGENFAASPLHRGD